jgi:thioredoxin 1
MGENTIILSDDTFTHQVLESPIPVLVDFYADWCGPCKMIAPFLDELAEKFIGKVTIAKMNVDTNTRTPTEFQVRSIPTMILFVDGKPEDIIIGADPSQIEKLVNKYK